MDLNKYDDEEIVKAIISLPAGKFLSVMNALGSIAQRIEARGKQIAQDNPDDVIDRMIRSLFEGDEER